MIGLDSDIDLAKNIIFEETKKLDFVIDNRTPQEIINNDPEFVVRLLDVTESGYKIRIYIWLIDPLKEFEIKSKLKESVHKRFRKEGVGLPIPLRKIIN
jgi:small-conductance mechanosensitive channel